MYKLLYCNWIELWGPLPMTDPWDEFRYIYIYLPYICYTIKINEIHVGIIYRSSHGWYGLQMPKDKLLCLGYFHPIRKVVSWGPVFAGDSTQPRPKLNLHWRSWKISPSQPFDSGHVFTHSPSPKKCHNRRIVRIHSLKL